MKQAALPLKFISFITSDHLPMPADSQETIPNISRSVHFSTQHFAAITQENIYLCFSNGPKKVLQRHKSSNQLQYAPQPSMLRRKNIHDMFGSLPLECVGNITQEHLVAIDTRCSVIVKLICLNNGYGGTNRGCFSFIYLFKN